MNEKIEQLARLAETLQNLRDNLAVIERSRLTVERMAVGVRSEIKQLAEEIANE